MGDNITQAERLLATIMAARSRVRGMASGLSFDAATRLEVRGTVGNSPVRQNLEVVHEVLESQVRAWRRTAMQLPGDDASPVRSPPSAAESSLFAEFLSEEERIAAESSVPQGEAPVPVDEAPVPVDEADPVPEDRSDWDAPEKLAPAVAIAPPDAPVAEAPARRPPTYRRGHFDFRREDPILPETRPEQGPDETLAPAPEHPNLPETRPEQGPDETLAPAPEDPNLPETPPEQGPDETLPSPPEDLPPILNAAPPARPPPKREKLPPPHPALASAAPPALAQPRAVPPRIVDPNAPQMAVDFSPADPRAMGATLDPAPALTPASAPVPAQPSVPSLAPVGSVEVFDTLTRAESAIQAGRLAEAVTLYGDALDMEPDHLDARLGRGQAHLHQGQFAAAMSDFQRAEDTAPASPAPLAAMGDLFFARKDYTRAVARYDQALDRDQGHTMALCRRGICHHYRGRPDLALADLVLARDLDPTIPSIDAYVAMVDGSSRHD